MEFDEDIVVRKARQGSLLIEDETVEAILALDSPCFGGLRQRHYLLIWFLRSFN